MIEEINNNHDILSHSKKIEYIASIKHKLLTQLKYYRKHIVNILIKTHIITIKDTKSNQNITLKPEPNKLKTGQQIKKQSQFLII